MKFLKREKKESLDELDLPPAPPPLEGFEESMPELPDLGEENISAGKDLPKFDFPEMEKDISMPTEEASLDFPSFPELEEKPMAPIPPVSAPPSMPEPMPSVPQAMSEPEQGITEEMPELPQQESHPKIERRLFHHEKRPLKERQDSEQVIKRGKTIYVRVDKFKATLGNINMVRSDLRKSEEALIKLENIKNAKDRSFDKMKSSLEDLQKKLIFVDKTLFKGDRNESL